MTQQSYRNESLELIEGHMRLRDPQLHALIALHEVLSTISSPIHLASYVELADAFKAKFPNWIYRKGNDVCPELTVHLATGVGKTKFIGSVMAYLFNANESHNFLIVTPRAEIVRKFIKELHPESPKYIFGDKSVVNRAEVITSDNIQTKNLNQLSLWNLSAPNVWVFSPQAFTAKGSKIKALGDFGAPSVSVLKNLKDLVVFFDESHHMGGMTSATSAWKKEIYDLDPRLIIGTTASVSLKSSTNILYSYPLMLCLREKQYTKQVQIIAEKIDSAIDEYEQDHIALRYAISRRKEKENALCDYVRINNISRNPKPVLLVCCTDIKHAEDTFAWLSEYLGSKEFVRIIHSELNEADYIPWLLELENDSSPVQVIVQVSMLNEGWDVSTVYGICPLRQMNSITMVEQVMGRGLRLPFGVPTGDKMIDELDIICFGRKGVQELANEAITGGYSGDVIGIRKIQDVTRHIPSVDVELEHCGKQGHPDSLNIPIIRRKVQIINLPEISIPRIEPSEIHGFEITDPQTVKDLGGSPYMERSAFLSAASSVAIKRAKYISESLQKVDMITLISNLLDRSGVFGNVVNFSPEAVAGHVKKHLDRIYTSITPEYFSAGGSREIPLKGIQIQRQEGYKIINEATITSDAVWTRSKGSYQLISGWKRCVHCEVPFDVYHEMTIARCIDRCPDVAWWFRNLPSILALDTPAGRYSPDFAILLTLDKRNILLEVKGDIYAEADTSLSSVKKYAAELWCQAASQADGKPWEYWFLLDTDAKYCNTWSDIEKKADKG